MGRLFLMAHILAVGIATIDIINHVSQYPAEDDEVRALSQTRSRGGNATNTLVVLSQLGHQCHWSGVLIDEPDAAIVESDLQHYAVDYSNCLRLGEGKMPTSYITLSEASGSRSIVHHRDCPELSFSFFQSLDLSAIDWIHFEGRNVAELERMLAWIRLHYPDLRCSLEVEKPRDGIEALFALPDVLMFSRPYARHQGFDNAADFLQSQHSPALMTCTWGEQGAWLKDLLGMIHSPAYAPDKVLDTLGAGDTFNAGLISALANDESPSQALAFACQLAGRKCGQFGFDNLSNQL
jgi:ketohexokinase